MKRIPPVPVDYARDTRFGAYRVDWGILIVYCLVLGGFVTVVFVPHWIEQAFPPKAVHASVPGLTYVLRSAMAQYRQDHAGQFPTSDGTTGGEWRWELLLSPTQAADGRTVGPYLKAAPVNYLTNSSGVGRSPGATVGWVLTREGAIYGVDAHATTMPY